MKILTGEQIRQADLRTMEREPISSIGLMERSSVAMVEHIKPGIPRTWLVMIFAGKGNNGGDGFAMARLLSLEYDVMVLSLGQPEDMTLECRANFKRLPENVSLAYSDDLSADFLLEMLDGKGWDGVLILDALLGTGVRGMARGKAAEAIVLLNDIAAGYVSRLGRQNVRVISVDLPSGLSTEPEGFVGASSAASSAAPSAASSAAPSVAMSAVSSVAVSDASSPAASSEGDARRKDCRIVHADETLTLEFPKLSLLLPATGAFAGKVSIIGIGLDREFIESSDSALSFVLPQDVDRMIPERSIFAHKGNFGHALLIAGSRGMMGAAVLATGAALRSGCGLVTAHIPDNERFIIQTTCPSAIVDTDAADCFSTIPADCSKYSAIGIGCGLRQSVDTVKALGELLSLGRPLVLDADALNIIASRPDYLDMIPAGSILTPHLGELSRLLAADSASSAADPSAASAASSSADSPASSSASSSVAPSAVSTADSVAFSSAASAASSSADSPLSSVADPDAVSIAKSSAEDVQRIAAVRRLAAKTKSVIVVKGAHTMIVIPDGRLIFNMTGNPGMAKGGSGDVLTGLITGLRARGLSAEQAAIAGVCYHGQAGDSACTTQGEGSMTSADIVSHLRLPH